MAKVKFSALVSEMRNKLNGSVFSKNRGGNYLRNKVTPVNPNTSRQTAVRSALAGFASGFRALTAAQIAAWNAAVSSFPYTDIFGDVKTLSGIQLYIKLNMNLTTAGQSAISSPPAPVGVDPLTSAAAAAAAGGAKTFTFAATPVPAGHTLIIECTPSVSPGRTFVKNQYRFIKAVAAAATSPQTITTEYNAKFGDVVTGEKVFMRGYLVNNTTGEVSLSLSDDAICT